MADFRAMLESGRCSDVGCGQTKICICALADEMVDEIERLQMDAKTSRELADDYKADTFRLHAEKMIFFDALLEMRCRDDRNGSLPPAYRKIIDAALTSGQGIEK